ncbi:hypothetical protein N7478_004204 [Penicillium angulare]|uniref:uncharacterized protein n=1 Tax=Penicillium angulare TaxID=116970 RepID=UPI00253F70F8|nr:uncharacterized protein N7478_004204 [Penicillium angulare]KAJ5278832.1 hypothetical protein N7478_004204 [Penicillium angulare]
MTQPTSQIRATYRALLREIPARSRTLASPSPLQTRLRTLFRSQEQHPSTNTNEPTEAFSSTSTTIPFSLPSSAEESSIRFQEAEQMAKYARAQRTYVQLLRRYNPGMDMDDEERIRLTARRVGFNLPELHTEGKE